MLLHLSLNGTPYCQSGIGPVRALMDAVDRGEISRHDSGMSCSYCDRDEAEKAAATLARFGFPFVVVEGGCPSYRTAYDDMYGED